MSRHIVAVRHDISQLGPWPCPVLVQGETGAGKDVVARLLHEASGRRGAFVQIAGKEISPSLLHSTLYGHERGAFSGAVERQLGVVERALGGTLFLDELGDVTKKTQGALLGVLEERSFGRVGGANDLLPDVRIVLATQHCPEELVAKGRLRKDFLFRLGYERILLLPLGERPEDIEPLAEHVLRRFAAEMKRPVSEPDDEVLRLLQTYRWPGNVRELESVVEFAARRVENGVIRLAHLPPAFLQAAGCLAQARAARRTDGLEGVLRETRGNLAQTARRLGVDPKTVRRWVRERGIDLGGIRVQARQ